LIVILVLAGIGLLVFFLFNEISAKNRDTAIGVIIGTLVSAVLTLLGAVFKDYWLPILNEKRTAKNQQKDAYQRYASPVAQAAIGLLWRLKDTFSGQGAYLLRNTAKEPFFEYKFIGTQYRLMSLLAWLRAAEREVETYQSVGSSKNQPSWTKAIVGVRSVLADSQPWQQRIVKHLLGILPTNYSPEQPLNSNMKDALVPALWEYQKQAAHMLPGQKKLQQDLQAILENNDASLSFVADITPKQHEQILNLAQLKQHYIYRDWQAGIGDIMLTASNSPERKLEVISFKAFEDLINSPKSNAKLWFDRVGELFNEVDVSYATMLNDIRACQLIDLFNALNKLVKAIFREYPSLEKTIGQYQHEKGIQPKTFTATFDQFYAQKLLPIYQQHPLVKALPEEDTAQ